MSDRYITYIVLKEATRLSTVLPLQPTIIFLQGQMFQGRPSGYERYQKGGKQDQIYVKRSVLHKCLDTGEVELGGCKFKVNGNSNSDAHPGVTTKRVVYQLRIGSQSTKVTLNQINVKFANHQWSQEQIELIHAGKTKQESIAASRKGYGGFFVEKIKGQSREASEAATNLFFAKGAQGVRWTPPQNTKLRQPLQARAMGLEGLTRFPYVCATMGARKATGLDGLQSKFFKSPKLIQPYLGMVEDTINGKCEPYRLLSFRTTRIVKLSKSDSPTITDDSNWRPIQIQSNGRKALEKAVLCVQNLFDWQSEKIQHGGFAQRSTATPLIKVIRDLALGKVVVFLDVKKAYDRIDRGAIALIWRAKGQAMDTMLQNVRPDG